jgi:hypothetical protein
MLLAEFYLLTVTRSQTPTTRHLLVFGVPGRASIGSVSGRIRPEPSLNFRYPFQSQVVTHVVTQRDSLNDQ